MRGCAVKGGLIRFASIAGVVDISSDAWPFEIWVLTLDEGGQVMLQLVVVAIGRRSLTGETKLKRVPYHLRRNKTWLEFSGNGPRNR